MQFLNKSLLEKVTQDAKASERLRMNYNFHDWLESPAQRLLNALEPGTIIPVHRHWHSTETYILLRGKIRVLFYNNNKEVIREELLAAGGEVFGVHIEKGEWHTVEVLESGSVLFEVKDGPYMPVTTADVLE